MSSTNRGGERAKDDFYETPEHCTASILDRLIVHGGIPTPDIVFDPGAGKGAILKVVRAYFPEAQLTGIEIDPEMAALCRSQDFAVHTGDFLVGETVAGFPTPRGFATQSVLIIGNPPYRLALPFILRCLSLLLPTAQVNLLQLLRMNFAASRERRSFHHEHPADMYVLPGRPSFRTVIHHVYRCTSPSCNRLTGVRESEPAPFCSHCGTATTFATKRKIKSDSTEYAWWLWGADFGGHWEVL